MSTPWPRLLLTVWAKKAQLIPCNYVTLTLSLLPRSVLITILVTISSYLMTLCVTTKKTTTYAYTSSLLSWVYCPRNLKQSLHIWWENGFYKQDFLGRSSLLLYNSICYAIAMWGLPIDIKWVFSTNNISHNHYWWWQK